MADHFYSKAVGKAGIKDVSSWTIDTSTTAGSKIEVRIEDGGMTRRQAYLMLEELADMIASASAADVLPDAQFTG